MKVLIYLQHQKFTSFYSVFKKLKFQRVNFYFISSLVCSQICFWFLLGYLSKTEY